MTGPTHIALGISSALLLGEIFHLNLPPLEVTLCVIGALAPDIDEPSSSISRPGNLLFPFIPRALRTALNAVGGTIAQVINFIFGHRNITHWGAVPLALLLLAIWSDSFSLFLFAVGYLSHLVGDICTIQGIPLFAPLSRKRYSLLPIRVGGMAERILSALLWIGVGSSLFLK